jgi:hypothetical protein
MACHSGGKGKISNISMLVGNAMLLENCLENHTGFVFCGAQCV